MLSTTNVLRRLAVGISLAAMMISMITVTSAPVMAGDTDKEKTDMSTVRVLMKTSMGNIILELDHAKAPITVDNFQRYTDEGYYDGTIFHRVIGTFMIQGGGFTPDMVQKTPHDPIENEWKNGLKNKRGSIAMARLGGKANSATCQFFINVVDNAGLDQPQPSDGAGYAVFGNVVEGMDVVDAIRKVKTSTKGGHGNVPVEPVLIEKVVRVNDKGEEIKPDKKAAPKSGEGK